ncbi:unnamed protein product [Diamesa serratosioi]
MAIFETRLEKKTLFDDRTNIKCEIINCVKKSNHTEYILHFQRGTNEQDTWIVSKRYNEFYDLHKKLSISNVDYNFPDKKFIGNMRADFVQQRQLELQSFINQVLMNPILASSLPTKKFIDPDSYSTPFHDVALQNSIICLRSEGQWSIGQLVGAIGWRLRKSYFKVVQKPSTKNSPGQSNQKHFLVKSGSQHVQKGPHISTSIDKEFHYEYVLSWTEYGPDKYIIDKDVVGVFNNLSTIQHPFIFLHEFMMANDNGCLVIRKLNKLGSLKDLLCGAQPLNPYLQKYGSPKGRSPLPIHDVAMYSRQVLEALRWLHSKGLTSGHVHAGNVYIVDGIAKLCDIENFVLGCSSFYRPFFVQHNRINSVEAIDVYSFGHLLYEMTRSYSLQDSYSRAIIDCPESLKNLLESVVTKEALKSNLPTLDQLAYHPFFTEYAPGFQKIHQDAIVSCKPNLKFSTTTKDILRIAVEKTEQRLRDEQKLVKSQKRMVRVQELMTSEEEKKKHNKQKKSDQKHLKLQTQISIQSSTILSGSQIDSGSETGDRSSPIQTSTPPTPILPSTAVGIPDTVLRTDLLSSISGFNKTVLKKVDSIHEN